MKTFRIILFLLFLCSGQAWAAQDRLDTDTIPGDLKQWIPWVLHGKEQKLCPACYNDGTRYLCAWPSYLEMSLTDAGGRFTQHWMVYAGTGVDLPGNPESWPESVSLDGIAVPVVSRGATPVVFMEPGRHLIEGEFVWDEMPEMIDIPPSSGIVRLKVNDSVVDFPVYDSKGRIWLQKKESLTGVEDRLEVRTFRLVQDTIPMELITLLKMNVSGKAREIVLEKVLPGQFIPMEINSPVPARMGPDGKLMIQVRPGRWEIRVTSRSSGPVTGIGPVDTVGNAEIWAFESRSDLRMVRIEGVSSIDPGQTDVPPSWRGFPTYMVSDRDTMIFQEQRRGDPDPAPDQLHLKRSWWLDFNGAGFTVQDTITGTMSRQWYLAMNPPGILGHVSVDGIDQLITSHGSEEKAGVELRRGQLNLVAESRYENSIKDLYAVGWDHEVLSVEGMLNLPPGWKIFSAGGVDNMPGTWLNQWTLLDLFLVLIISLAISKLWSWRWGVVALITISLIYHETGCPRLVWLHLLAACALLRFLPEGMFKRIINLWWLGAVITLAVLAVPFMVNQVRVGIYPQLEQVPYYQQNFDESEGVQQYDTPMESVPSKVLSRSDSYQKLGDKLYERQDSQSETFLAQDPNALIQTGPGLPDWNWRSYPMKWNGPVDRNQTVRVWLISPFFNLVLAFVRVLLLTLLIVRVIPFHDIRVNLNRNIFGQVMLGFIFLPGLLSADAMASSFPPAELLKELESRLLEKPECLPSCAQCEQMHLVIRENILTLQLVIHCAARTAVPLVSSELWMPHDIAVDGSSAEALLKDRDGVIWALIPDGVHEIVIQGMAPPVDSYDISLPLKPHRVAVDAQGWEVNGVDGQGRIQGSIQLVRKDPGQAREQFSGAVQLSPFLHLERVLILGVQWEVVNTLKRLTPVGVPIMVSIPLVQGESVTTPGIRVESSSVQIAMEPDQQELQWVSSLAVSESIELDAPEDVLWTETWILDASPIWHCDLSGIPVIHHKDSSGRWNPTWRPWPGEHAEIMVSRPKTMQGKVFTIDGARLTYTPGLRLSNAMLDLSLRSSQGHQHTVTLPENAKVEKILIMGKDQPIREQERSIILPLTPGKQDVHLEWHMREDAGAVIRGPLVDIGEDAVNAHITFQMPHNRWILFAGGPRLGPAVLFWSYLLVVIIVAVALGRVDWTPLSTRHWFLLGMGITQVHPMMAIVIVGWFLGLGWRKKQTISDKWYAFNLMQLLYGLWTIAALAGLYTAIQHGLLGLPDMQISGNDSYNTLLNWTQDRISNTLPIPWVLSAPLFVYRILMLLWALWIAYSLLGWLKWGWECFSKDGIWKKMPLLKRKKDVELKE